ncbi:hypothetical protein [Bradyrhizobium sp. 164]|uniref:hypothetical protein n=1 Tax=Bradyrhizobium sp. 164 TaxID=2782637 RepID=UPI001FF74F93|nr:hypothetical protein [Bradyrhizobium sp. 164]MCK1593343.1 hypothetical protein [Bradyrhizobium sp. 164]
MPIDPFKPITYSAARRRYKRATGQSLCTLTARESEFHSGAKYALVNKEGDITATGNIDTVEAWCRGEGVLMPHEFLKQAA